MQQLTNQPSLSSCHAISDALHVLKLEVLKVLKLAEMALDHNVTAMHFVSGHDCHAFTGLLS